LTAHEQGAAHAADGYARSTGKVGVCLATSGPGATNIVTGIATAYMDSVPMIAITCNVGSSLLGRDSFQEVDIAGITMPITKHNYIIKDINSLADTVREAFVIANSGRKGPVLIDIPKDITASKTEYVKADTPPQYCKTVPCMSEKQLLEATQIINKSKRPIIVAGGGVVSSGASKELFEFANLLNCPVSTTFMGTGAFPCDNELYTGMIGMHGTKASNIGITKSDLIIAIGARFSDRVTSNVNTFAKESKILHIDIDEAEIDKNIFSYYAITGDAKDILSRLCPNINKRNIGEWTEEVLFFKKDFPSMDKNNENLNPEFILNKIHQYTKGEAIITTEVGQHQMWTQQFYNFTKPRTFISSGGLGTMGFGTGAAIGCAVGNPDKQVVAVAGDGSFRMNCNELATISDYNIPLIIVIVDNGVLGMVRQWQTLFYEKRYSQTTLNSRGPNFKLLAQAYGIKGYDVSTKEEFEQAIKEACERKAPCVIDAHIDKDDFVLPMVAPGKPIKSCFSKIEAL
ncbi:MAG: biosynthetic-type acetolactate synthase large subunit, partial [Oscillospiraceae bacterium]